jgi:hypothetical protein
MIGLSSARFIVLPRRASGIGGAFGVRLLRILLANLSSAERNVYRNRETILPSSEGWICAGCRSYGTELGRMVSRFHINIALLRSCFLLKKISSPFLCISAPLWRTWFDSDLS